MSSFCLARNKRMSFYQSQLQQVDERASAVRSELADALLTLARAQDTVDALRCDLDCLTEQSLQLQSTLESASQMDPAVIRMLPPEILRLIFLEVCALNAPFCDIWEGWERICETPLLEELVACTKDDVVGNPWHAGFPDYLPFSPRLKMMRTDGCHILWSAPRTPQAALRHLELEVDLPPRAIWDVLRLATSLEELQLDVPHEPRAWTGDAPENLCMHRLRRLELMHRGGAVLSTWPGLLQLPALTFLYTRFAPWEELVAISLAAQTSITSLEVVADEFESFDCDTLQAFTAVKEAHITGSCSACFFERVTTSVMWPNLEEMVLKGAELDVESSDALLSLVRARRRGVGQAGVQLKNIRFENCEVPDWLEDQAKGLMQPATSVSTE
ncbi:hypothetical protein AURDEDRAFT_171666 [Auricularia subglabra TFB-10046 SS5]|nr:hypothetical protein AURDEDRAFT_171666 [Auricularia subglabra TFB-10046 SS5]